MAQSIQIDGIYLIYIRNLFVTLAYFHVVFHNQRRLCHQDLHRQTPTIEKIIY